MDKSRDILILNNQRLAVQLEEKKKEHKILEGKVDAYEQRQQDFADTVLCINRIWTLLEGDVQHIAAAACGELGDNPAAPGPSSLALAGVSAAAVAAGKRDPYLQRLLQGAPAAATKAVLEAHKHLETGISSTEEALLDRANATKAALAKVLEKVQGLKASQQQLGLQLASCSGAEGVDAALRSDYQRLSKEASAQRRELDTARAAARAAQQQQLLSEDRQLQAEQRITKLQNELADAEQELSSFQKKVFTANLKSANSLEAGLGPSSLAAGSFPTLPSANGRLGTQGASSSDAVLEAAELQVLLVKRTAELDKERDEHHKASRELQEALSKVNDEGWVQSTRVFQIASRQIQQLMDQLMVRQKEVEGLARERDDAQREAHTRSQVYLSEALATSRLQAADKAYRELQFAKAESDRQRQELQMVLQRERDKLGHTRTVSELKIMITALQQEVSTLQQHAQHNKACLERLQAASTSAHEAASTLQAHEQETTRLQDALRRRDNELDEQIQRQQPLRDQVVDLQAFVEVLTTFCDDPRDVVDVRASEASLQKQLTIAKAQLEGHPLQQRIAELEATQRVARDQLDLVAIESDALRLQLGAAQRSAAELEAQLAAARAECQLYISEVETTSQAYEDMQSQNTRLLQQLTERDEANNLLAADKLKVNQTATSLQEQLNAAHAEHDRLQRELSDVGNVREATDRELARIAQELMQTKELLRTAVIRSELLSQDLRRRDDSLAQAAAISTSHQQAASEARAAADEASERFVKEKTKRQRLEEENQSLQNKLERARKALAAAGSNGGIPRAVQEELDAMRALLNCNVCHERQKNTIIVKCGHVFCDKCIKSIVDARSRKCPGCGAAFASSDVKSFYFT